MSDSKKICIANFFKIKTVGTEIRSQTPELVDPEAYSDEEDEEVREIFAGGSGGSRGGRGSTPDDSRYEQLYGCRERIALSSSPEASIGKFDFDVLDSHDGFQRVPYESERFSEVGGVSQLSRVQSDLSSPCTVGECLVQIPEFHKCTTEGCPRCHLYNELSDKPIRRRIVQSVHRDFSDSRWTDSIYTDLRGRIRHLCGRYKGFIAVFKHYEGPSPHLHVLHDCAWSNSSCRCRAVKFLTDLFPLVGRKVSGKGNRVRVILSILKYFCTPPRQLLFMEVDGAEYTRIFDQNRYLQCCEDSDVGTAEVVDCSGIPFNSSGAVQLLYPSSNEGDSRANDKSRRETTGKRKGGKEKVLSEIIRLILTYCIAPPERICETDIWYRGDMTMFLLNSDKIFLTSLTMLSIRFNSWMLRDYVDYFRCHNPDRLYYDCTDNSPGTLYMRIEPSIEAILTLLFHHFLTLNGVISFLQILESWFDKKLLNKKINTMTVTGPPNSGKSFFFDAFCAFILNYGNLTNPSRHERFAFQDCLNRRVIKWNEAKLDPAHEELFLDLMQGNVVKVNIKFKNPTNIVKTPLLVISNNNVFPNTDRFNMRQIKYYWHACEALKIYSNKPHPWCILLIIDYLLYNNSNEHYDIEGIINKIIQ